MFLRNQKLKNNKYEVLIDETKVVLYDDIIVKYSLLLNKEISKNELDKIVEENNKLDSYYKALKYISVKLRTKKEIKN